MTKHYSIEEVIAIGKNRGRKLAQYCIAENNNDTIEELKEVIISLKEYMELLRNECWEADENYRQHSPFEFFAHALNEDDNSEELWENYDKGLHQGIDEVLEEHTAAKKVIDSK